MCKIRSMSDIKFFMVSHNRLFRFSDVRTQCSLLDRGQKLARKFMPIKGEGGWGGGAGLHYFFRKSRIKKMIIWKYLLVNLMNYQLILFGLPQIFSGEIIYKGTIWKNNSLQKNWKCLLIIELLFGRLEEIKFPFPSVQLFNFRVVYA